MKPWVKFLWVVFAFGLFLWLVRLALAAQSPPPAFSPPRLREITARPIVDMNGTLLHLIITARIQVIEHKPSGEVDSHDVGSVEFDLLQTAGESVMVGGSVREYRDIGTGIYAAALQEWQERIKEPEVIPLPQRRRATRTK